MAVAREEARVAQGEAPVEVLEAREGRGPMTDTAL